MGIFGGLFNYATAIFNAFKYVADTLVTIVSDIITAILSAVTTFATSFLNAFNYVAQGLWTALNTFGNWVWTAFSLIGQALAWLFNAFMGALETVWNVMIGALRTWFTDIATVGNDFISMLVSNWRAKMKLTIMADMTLFFGWQAAQSAVTGLTNITDTGQGIGGMVKSMLFKVGAMLVTPFAAALGGAMLGELLDSLLPSTDLNVTIFPTFNLTQPTISLPRMSDPTGLSQPSAYSGITATMTSDFTAQVSASYDEQNGAGLGQDNTAAISSTYDTSVA